MVVKADKVQRVVVTRDKAGRLHVAMSLTGAKGQIVKFNIGGSVKVSQ